MPSIRMRIPQSDDKDNATFAIYKQKIANNLLLKNEFAPKVFSKLLGQIEK